MITLLFDEHEVTPEEQKQISQIHTSKNLLEEIEKIVQEKKLSYIEAVVYFCEATGLEVEVAGTLIKSNPKLKAAIQEEAEDLHYLPKTERLPI